METFMNIEHLRDENWQENRNNGREFAPVEEGQGSQRAVVPVMMMMMTCPSARLFTTEHTRLDGGSNTGRRLVKPATN
jgi:hypothetical protein